MEFKAVQRRATKVKEDMEQLLCERLRKAQIGEKRAERECDQLLQVHER